MEDLVQQGLKKLIEMGIVVESEPGVYVLTGAGIQLAELEEQREAGEEPS